MIRIKDAIRYMGVFAKLDQLCFSTKHRKYMEFPPHQHLKEKYELKKYYIELHARYRKCVELPIDQHLKEKYKLKKYYIELKYRITNTKGDLVINPKRDDILLFHYAPSSTMYDVTFDDFMKIAYYNDFLFLIRFPKYFNFQDCLRVIANCNKRKLKIIPLETLLVSKSYFEVFVEEFNLVLKTEKLNV